MNDDEMFGKFVFEDLLIYVSVNGLLNIFLLRFLESKEGVFLEGPFQNNI